MTNSGNLGAECPAFVNGCPFSEIHTQAEGAVRAAKEKCPAFKDECAFKSAGTLEELEQLLSTVCVELNCWYYDVRWRSSPVPVNRVPLRFPALNRCGWPVAAELRYRHGMPFSCRRGGTHKIVGNHFGFWEFMSWPLQAPWPVSENPDSSTFLRTLCLLPLILDPNVQRAPPADVQISQPGKPSCGRQEVRGHLCKFLCFCFVRFPPFDRAALIECGCA
jgi:hypothetical protein